MKKMNLNQKNQQYLLTQDSREKSRILFEGSELVKNMDNCRRFLYQESNECNADYEFRLKRAVVDPWIEKIVNARQGLLFNKPHQRNLNRELEPFLSDVDMSGTPAEVFFYDVSKQAQIDGIAFVEINMTPKLVDENGNQVVTTKSQDYLMNRRPFFDIVSGFDVYDWSFGDDLELDWVVIYTPKIEYSSGWGFDPVVVRQWKVWTRNEWFLYGLKNNTTERNPEYVLIDSNTHELGSVPLVPFYGVKLDNNVGFPVTRSVLDHIILSLNKNSDLDWFERVSSHPIPYSIGPIAPAKIDSGKGIHLTVVPEMPNASIGYLETTGAGFNSIRASLEDLRYRILSIMLSQAKKDSAQVQSAVSQREDRRMFTTSLKSVSSELERSEKRCWEFMYRWYNNTPNVDTKAVSINYNTDFDDREIESTMIKTLSELVTSNQLGLKTFIKKLIDGELLSPSKTVDEYINEIEEDIQRSTGIFDITNTMDENMNIV